MSGFDGWRVDLSERKEDIVIREILASSEPNVYGHCHLEAIDTKGRRQNFICTQEEQRRIRDGATIVLTIREKIVSARVVS